jgi:hypothetical protein
MLHIVTDPRHRRTLAGLLAVLILALPPAASAHGGASAPAATDGRAVVRSIAPPIGGLSVEVLDGDQSLWIAAERGSTVVVFGLAGEPFLRLVRGRVEVNDRSAEAHLLRTADSRVAMSTDPRSPPRWRPIGEADHLQWHEHRLAAPLGSWQVRVSVNGRVASIAGVHLRGPGPPLGALLLAVAALAVLGTLLPWTGIPCVVSFAAMLVAAVGGGFAGPHTPAARWSAVAGVVIAVVIVAAATSATPTRHRPWVAGGIGVTSAFLAAAQLAVLAKPYVNSALAATLARGLVVVAIGVGLGVAGAALRRRPWRAW